MELAAREREAELAPLWEMADWGDEEVDNDIALADDHDVDAAYAWEEEAAGYSSPRLCRRRRGTERMRCAIEEDQEDILHRVLEAEVAHAFAQAQASSEADYEVAQALAFDEETRFLCAAGPQVLAPASPAPMMTMMKCCSRFCSCLGVSGSAGAPM